jgi:hypothetical protein
MNKVGIQLDIETGGFISGMASAERAVKSLDQAIKAAEKDGKWEDAARLRIQQAALETSTSGFERDTKRLFNSPGLQTTTTGGLAAIKMDSESGQLFKDMTGTLKKLNATLVDQVNNQDYEGVWKTASQIQQEEKKYKKAGDEATAPAETQAMQALMKANVVGQIANSFNEGLRIWASSLDRSGIVSAYGSGDLLGGRLAEKQRMANIVGGGAQTVLGAVGAVASVIPGGQLLGVGLNAAGTGINTLAQGLLGGDKTETAYAELWQQRTADTMNLAALMGNPNMIREAFKTAADAAANFGYSAEEGMDAMNQAIRQGLNGDRAREITEQVFKYERSTGADRGTLSSVANMAARYGMGNPLKSAWGGLHASGLNTGQFNEYLRAVQRIMEDSISKGFKVSSEQIAQNLTLMSQIGGDNKTWQGEGGARRLQSMSSGLENAVGLQSSNDIHVFRAARQILGDNASWVDVNRLVEQGLSGEKGKELQYRTWALDYANEGGSREEFVGRQLGRGQSYDASIRMWDHFAPVFEKTGGNIAEALKIFEAKQKDFELINIKGKDMSLPDFNSPELKAAQLSAQTANIKVQTGQLYFDKMLPEFTEAHKKAETEFDEARRRIQSSLPQQPIPQTAITVEIELPGGKKVPANYYGSHSGVTNEPGGADYKAEMSYLMREIAGPYNRMTNRSSDMTDLYENFQRVTSGKYGQDTILDRSEFQQLMPILSKIAENKDMTPALERLIEKLDRLSDINITVE